MIIIKLNLFVFDKINRSTRCYWILFNTCYHLDQYSVINSVITNIIIKVIEKCTNFNFVHVGQQIVFQCEIWCCSVAKFVIPSVIDGIRIISVINRVASKNNLTTKPV